jgi:hypothetical protein
LRDGGDDRRARAFAFRQGANIAQASGHGAADFAENSPAIYGWVKCHQHKIKSRWDGRTFLSSLTGLEKFPNREPSHKWPGYFQKQISPTCTLFVEQLAIIINKILKSLHTMRGD